MRETEGQLYTLIGLTACLFCNLLSLGVQRAYGILFVEFLRMFQMSAGVTAVILSAQSAVTSIAGECWQTSGHDHHSCLLSVAGKLCVRLVTFFFSSPIYQD